jgi:AcrR family transcriptional regulator
VSRPSQKDKILDAALACFAERGYEGTRVRHIADRAGVSESALYRHYPSMDAVGQELYARHFSFFAERLAQVVADGTTEEKLRNAIRTTLATYRERPDAFVFALLRLPSFLPVLPAGTAYPIEVLEGVLVEGQRGGHVRDGQPNVLAAILLGCVLRPITVATFAAPGALDLLTSTEHDQVIEDSAIAAVTR